MVSSAIGCNKARRLDASTLQTLVPKLAIKRHMLHSSNSLHQSLMFKWRAYRVPPQLLVANTDWPLHDLELDCAAIPVIDSSLRLARAMSPSSCATFRDRSPTRLRLIAFAS